MKSKLEFYALSVCFAAVVCLTISFAVAGCGLVQAVMPDYTMGVYDYCRHKSNDAFFAQQLAENASDDKPERPAEADLTAQRLQSLDSVREVERRGGVQLLIHSLMVILSSGVAFALHWRVARFARQP